MIPGQPARATAPEHQVLVCVDRQLLAQELHQDVTQLQTPVIPRAPDVLQIHVHLIDPSATVTTSVSVELIQLVETIQLIN